MKLLLEETRVQWPLAILLALIAGYLDGYGLRYLGVYVSFMNGNTTSTGQMSGQGNFHAALPSAIAVLSFVTGSFLGNLFSQSRLHHSHRLIFGVIAGVLAMVARLEQHGLWNGAAEIATRRLVYYGQHLMVRQGRAKGGRRRLGYARGAGIEPHGARVEGFVFGIDSAARWCDGLPQTVRSRPLSHSL